MNLTKMRLFLSSHEDDYYKYNFWKRIDYQYIENFKNLCMNQFDFTVSTKINNSEIINESKTTVVDQFIRKYYIKNCSVTIVFIDNNSWKMKHKDIEISATLLNKNYIQPMGLIGIILPSFKHNNDKYSTIKKIDLENTNLQIPSTILPQRIIQNIDNGFVKLYKHTEEVTEIKKWINEAIIRSINIKPCNKGNLYVKNLYGSGWNDSIFTDQIINQEKLDINKYIN